MSEENLIESITINIDVNKNAVSTKKRDLLFKKIVSAIKKVDKGVNNLNFHYSYFYHEDLINIFTVKKLTRN